jgi:ABC-type transporter Mla subunit MlaD
MGLHGFWSARSLRYKLFLGILLTLAPIAAIVIASYQYNKNASVDNSGHVMELVAKNGARSINAYLAGESKIYSDWIKDDIYGLAIEFNTLDEMQSQFASMLEEAPDFALILLADKQGSILVAQGSHKYRDKTATLKEMKVENAPELLARSSASIDIAPSAILRSLGDKYPATLQFAFPAKNSSNEVCGLFIAYLDWAEVQKKTVAIAGEMTGQGLDGAAAAIIDKRGNIALGHSDEGNIGQTINGGASLMSWLSTASDLSIKVEEYNAASHFVIVDKLFDGRNQVDKEGRITGDTRLILALFVPEASIMGRVREVLYISLLFAGFGVLLSIIISYILDKSIARPIKGIIDSLAHGAGQVGSAAKQVAEASQSLAEGASQQASSLEETSSSLEEMAGMTRQNAENTKQANLLATEASAAADKGASAMEGMSNAMQEIKRSSDETAKIIKVIDEIAFQTNLLALNAAVEAARAGEAGKGFAVVAEEVRNLAQRSAEAAKNTSSLIEGSQKNADNGVRATKELVGILNEITSSIKKVSGLINEVTQASEEQSRGISQVNEAVAQMDQVTQQNAANAEESSSASEELSSQAQQMQEIVQELTLLVEGSKAAGFTHKQNEYVADAGWEKKSPVVSKARSDKSQTRKLMTKHVEKMQQHAQVIDRVMAKAEGVENDALAKTESPLGV